MWQLASTINIFHEIDIKTLIRDNIVGHAARTIWIMNIWITSVSVHYIFESECSWQKPLEFRKLIIRIIIESAVLKNEWELISQSEKINSTNYVFVLSAWYIILITGVISLR